MGSYLRGMAGFLIGFALVTLALQLTTPLMTDPFISVSPPTLAERLLRVLVAGTIAMIAGAVTAMIAGPAARPAALALTAVCALPAAVDLATRDARELSAVIALFVVPPCSLLGAELTARHFQSSRSGLTTDPPSSPCQ
jgi:hypothetical protein